MAFFPIFKLLGQLVGALVSFSVIDSEERSAYRLCFATQWPFSGVLSILAVLLPESPVWLLRKGKAVAAQDAVMRLQGGRKGRSEVGSARTLQLYSRKDARLTASARTQKAQADFEHLRATIEEEKQDSTIIHERYLDCLKQPQLRRTLLVCYAEFIPLFFGLQLLGSSSYFLQQIGMGATTSVL